MDCFKKKWNELYTDFKKFQTVTSFFGKGSCLFFAHQSLVASLSTLMEDWWISNFLKFNFTKRVHNSTKKTFEYVSSFPLKKLIINPLVALFSHSCLKTFPLSFVQSEFMGKISLRKTSIVWLSFDEKKKKFRQKHFDLIFVWNVSEIDLKLRSHYPKVTPFCKKKRLQLVWEKQLFHKNDVMC